MSVSLCGSDAGFVVSYTYRFDPPPVGSSVKGPLLVKNTLEPSALAAQNCADPPGSGTAFSEAFSLNGGIVGGGGGPVIVAHVQVARGADARSVDTDRGREEDLRPVR